MRRSGLILLAAGLVAGCSLLVQFDPESQPCDSAGLCLSGYFCSDAGLCKSLDGGVADAGGLDGSTCTARETACGDGRDNDCDNQTDCADTDCGGVGCDDRDACTTGETCSGGSCMRGSAVVCNSPPNPCQMSIGTCEAGTGRCLYSSLPDGTLCGTGSAARCCAGTCINLALNAANCGGCGIACATGQTCQSLELGGCTDGGALANTSGRCTCSTAMVNGCPNGQTCSAAGVCRPASNAQCAPNQSLGDGGVLCGPYCRY